MEAVLEQIRDQQKEAWNKFSPGWKKWDDLVMAFLKPMGDEIIRLIKPKDGEKILDIAAGTGEPGLTIAGMIPNGSVVVTDIAEGMLEVARENAERRGLKNLTTMVADAGALPFEDNTFDAISCRMGFMFFPDMQMAANEMARVLKPGGRVATSVWSVPEKNFWMMSLMGVIKKNIEMPPPQPGAPGMLRCAEKGVVSDLFKNAGLKNMSEREINGTLNVGTADRFWSFHTEVAAPVVAALSKADEPTKLKVKKEVFDLLYSKFQEGKVNPEFEARVIYAEK